MTMKTWTIVHDTLKWPIVWGKDPFYYLNYYKKTKCVIASFLAMTYEDNVYRYFAQAKQLLRRENF